jgi:hypothetical protein
MIWSTPILKDATIYESDPYRNTGLDQIVELRKDGDSSTGDLTESRILMQVDLSSLGAVLSENNISINDISASLNLYTVQTSELPTSYTIEAKALFTSWSNGSGYTTLPATNQNNIIPTDGATWFSTAGSGSITWSGSWNSNTSATMLYNSGSTIGGGVWYTASVASQSFSFKSSDTVNLNVTDIVKKWYNSTFVNNGFLVTFNHNAIQASNYPNTILQFYSSETHTVYEPQLYISWTGSVTYDTGSMSLITYEDSPIIYTKSFKSVYNKDTKIRILLGSRVKYPRPTFSQNSDFATQKALPSTTYYQIKDAHNDNIIIPYSNATKINTNSNGSYFDLYTTMLYPERYYKFEIKAVFSDITEYFAGNDFVFKITN